MQNVSNHQSPILGRTAPGRQGSQALTLERACKELQSLLQQENLDSHEATFEIPVAVQNLHSAHEGHLAYVMWVFTHPDIQKVLIEKFYQHLGHYSENHNINALVKKHIEKYGFPFAVFKNPDTEYDKSKALTAYLHTLFHSNALDKDLSPVLEAIQIVLDAKEAIKTERILAYQEPFLSKPFEPTQLEWSRANAALEYAQDGTKFDKYEQNFFGKDKGLKRSNFSFIKIEGVNYALSNQTCFYALRGGFGKIKLAMTQEGQTRKELVAVKVTSGRDESTQALTPSKKTGFELARAYRKKWWLYGKNYSVSNWAGLDLGHTFLELNELQTLLLFLKSCTALQKIHQLNIIHADVKPKNMVLYISPNDPYDLRVQFIDFDTSLMLGCDEDFIIPSTNQPISFDYLAPEILNQWKFSKASDVYALGLTLDDPDAFCESALRSVQDAFRIMLSPDPSDRILSAAIDIIRAQIVTYCHQSIQYNNEAFINKLIASKDAQDAPSLSKRKANKQNGQEVKRQQRFSNSNETIENPCLVFGFDNHHESLEERLETTQCETEEPEEETELDRCVIM